MGFQTGLAGLNAATKNLDIIGNNIANANTVGAKASRAEFAALVSSAGSGGTDTGQGIGVQYLGALLTLCQHSRFNLGFVLSFNRFAPRLCHVGLEFFPCQDSHG